MAGGVARAPVVAVATGSGLGDAGAGVASGGSGASGATGVIGNDGAVAVSWLAVSDSGDGAPSASGASGGSAGVSTARSGIWAGAATSAASKGKASVVMVGVRTASDSAS